MYTQGNGGFHKFTLSSSAGELERLDGPSRE
jgi:hypothetical protein